MILERPIKGWCELRCPDGTKIISDNMEKLIKRSHDEKLTGELWTVEEYTDHVDEDVFYVFYEGITTFDYIEEQNEQEDHGDYYDDYYEDEEDRDEDEEYADEDEDEE